MTMRSAKDLVEAANREVEVLSVTQARAIFDRGDAQFVDVREPGEWAKGHVPGALHVPRGLLEWQADQSLPTHKAEFDQKKKLVVYCASGGRSALAAKTLKDMGYDDVAHVQGGFAGWSKDGNPVEA